MEKKKQAVAFRTAFLWIAFAHIAVDLLFVLFEYVSMMGSVDLTDALIWGALVLVMLFAGLYFWAETRLCRREPRLLPWGYLLGGVFGGGLFLLFEWLILSHGSEYLPHPQGVFFGGLEYLVLFFLWAGALILMTVMDAVILVARAIFLSGRKTNE